MMPVSGNGGARVSPEAHGVTRPAMEGARRNVGGELKAASLPEIHEGTSWLEAAETLYRWIESAAIETVNWYLTEKRSKARWSRCLRVVAVVFTLLGSLAPFIAVGTDKPWYALWGYPCLAIGAGSVGLDRVFGFSSSWMRYQAAVASIQRIMIGYQLRWAEITNISDPSNHPDPTALIEIIDKFADDLSALVDGETQNWAREFRGHVSRLEADASHL